MAEEIKKEEQLGNCNFIHDFIDEDIAEGINKTWRRPVDYAWNKV